MDDLIKQAAQAIHDAQVVTILTGAGVSKESGVPTFRDALDGLWAKYDPQELATRYAFKTNPKLCWDWYEWRREMVGKAKPNAGHFALAKLQGYKTNLHLVTQNVDSLHEIAGSKNVVHLHGELSQTKCFDDCQGDPTIIDLETLVYDKDIGPPPCPHCFAYVRPAVVWFGELLPKHEYKLAHEYSQNCDVMLVVGTSGLVSPASQLPTIAKAKGSIIIEVNPDESMITRIADIKLDGASGEILPKVIEAMDELQK